MPFAAGDLGSVQPARNADLDSLATKAHGGIHGFADGPAKGNALLQLQRDGFRHQLRIQLGLVDLLNVQVHLAPGSLLQIGLQLVNLRALTPDDDAGPGRADTDAQFVRHTVDLDGRDARRAQPFLEVALQLEILMEPLAIIPLGKPPRLPRLVVTEPESIGMNLLSHSSPLPDSFSRRSAAPLRVSRRPQPQCGTCAADRDAHGPSALAGCGAPADRHWRTLAKRRG